MLYRVLDLPFSKARGGLDDDPLQRLLHGHEVVRVRERLYFLDGLPHLIVTVAYRLATLAGPRSGPDASCAQARRRSPGRRPWRSPSSRQSPHGSVQVALSPCQLPVGEPFWA
jgi:hypothetical protein